MTMSYTGSANGTLRFEVYGSSLKLFLNGTLVAYTNDTNLTGGSVGMRTNAGATLSNFSASVLTVATPTLPFSDTFGTASTPGLNQLTSNWINQVGNFRVNTSNGTATGFGGYDLATLVGVNATNVAVQATIALTTGEAAGLVADYTGTGDGTYYFGSIFASGTNAYQANLYRANNGTFTPLFTQSYLGSANGTLLFDVYGGSLKLFFNGSLVAYGNDATLTGGSVGMRTNMGATLSNFSASVLTTTSTTDPGQLPFIWINQVGNFSYSGSTATGSAGYDLATMVGVNDANVAVQSTIALTTGEAAGLVADYTGSGEGSYYFGSIYATPRGIKPTSTAATTAGSITSVVHARRAATRFRPAARCSSRSMIRLWSCS